MSTPKTNEEKDLDLSRELSSKAIHMARLSENGKVNVWDMLARSIPLDCLTDIDKLDDYLFTTELDYLIDNPDIQVINDTYHISKVTRDSTNPFEVIKYTTSGSKYTSSIVPDSGYKDSRRCIYQIFNKGKSLAPAYRSAKSVIRNAVAKDITFIGGDGTVVPKTKVSKEIRDAKNTHTAKSDKKLYHVAGEDLASSTARQVSDIQRGVDPVEHLSSLCSQRKLLKRAIELSCASMSMPDAAKKELLERC